MREKKEKGGGGGPRKETKIKIICSSSLSVEIMFGELYTFDLCSIL